MSTECGRSATFGNVTGIHGDRNHSSACPANVIAVIVTTESDTEIRIISMRKAKKMRKKSTSATFDEDAPIKHSDIKSGKLVLCKRDATGAILPNK